MKLHDCSFQSDQISWAVAHLKAGGSLSNISLWINGVDQPMRVVGQAKVALREEGISVGKVTNRVRDAGGLSHDILVWRIDAQASEC